MKLTILKKRNVGKGMNNNKLRKQQQRILRKTKTHGVNISKSMQELYNMKMLKHVKKGV